MPDVDVPDGTTERTGAALRTVGRVGLLSYGVVHVLVAVLAVIAMFQLFAEPYVMTEGGPAQSTITVLYLMFDQGFQWWNLGIGAAVAVVLFACILAAALIPALALRIYRRRRA